MPGDRRLPQRLEALRTEARRILVVDVLPFWEGTIDSRYGGYRLHHDANGVWLGPADKALVTQARTLWSFARLTRAGLYAGPGMDAGYEFLRDRLWDAEHGGVYWAVDATGATPTQPGKHLYAQAFGLFALCEHARTTGAAESTSLARRSFAVLDGSHDDDHGGWVECFDRAWGRLDPGAVGHLGRPAGRKLLNTHVHLLEAITAYVRLTGDPQGRRRLGELVGLCSRTVVDQASGGCRDEFHADWSPVAGARNDRVSYGHDLENAALLGEALEVLGGVDGGLHGRCRRMCDNALAHGLDPLLGGFFESGALGCRADAVDKVWWVQGEALHGLAAMWRATGDLAYLQALEATMGWLATKQVDTRHGDLHARVSAGGVTSGTKADEWKDPYHHVRGLLAVVDLPDGR